MATITDRYVLEVDTKGGVGGLNSAGGAVTGLGSKLMKLGPLALAATAALGGFAAISGIKSTIDDMDALAKSARLAGVAVGEQGAFKDFQVLKKAMGEAGVDAGTFERGMMQLNTRLKAGSEGQKSYAGVVEKLGSSIRDSNGELLTGSEAMQVMINALNAGTISTEEFAKVVGGRAGPVIQQQFAELQDGAAGLAATLADVEANSNIVSSDAAENAEVFNDTIGRLGEAAGQLGTDISTALLPILVELAEGALTYLPVVIEGVKSAFAALMPIIEALQPVGQALLDLLAALWPVFETLLAVIGPVAEIIGGAFTLAIKGIVIVIETVIGVITRMVQGIKDIAASISEVTGAVGQKWDGMTTGLTDGAKGAYDGVTGWFGKMYDDVVGNSIIPDLSDDVLKVFDGMNKGMGDKTAKGALDVARGFNSVAANIAGGFSSQASAALKGVGSLVDQVSGGLYSKISNLTKDVSGSFDGLFGGGGGGGGSSFLDGIVDSFGAMSGLSSLFGGLAAPAAGPAAGNSRLGERSIQGTSMMRKNEATSNVTYNIQAVDAISFRNLVARDPGFIHAVANKGARKVPGRFA